MRDKILSLFSILLLSMLGLFIFIKGLMQLSRTRNMNDAEEKGQNRFSSIGSLILGGGGIILLIFALLFM